MNLDELLRYAEELAQQPELMSLIERFVRNREKLTELGYEACYSLFSLDTPTHSSMMRLGEARDWIKKLRQAKPRSVEDFDKLETVATVRGMQICLRSKWEDGFQNEQPWVARAASYVKNLWRTHPLFESVVQLEEIIADQLSLWEQKDTLDSRIWSGLSDLHSALAPSGRKPLDVRLELWLAASKSNVDEFESIQSQLERLASWQDERDVLVRQQFIYALGELTRRAFEKPQGTSTNRLTRVGATLERLESLPSWSRAREVIEELQEQLMDVFPIWICRKQAVAFVLPCKEQLFDFVIVDEATQCRVDDALPLLFRAKKLMAVGDEAQTGLSKNSSIDDYLFDDFELDEHLSFAQARGMKGGGSHLLGLVKRIKQASLMLVEHYRCPPDIIEFSNKYVYDNELRVMQWKMVGAPRSVVVDYSEAKVRSGKKPSSGKYKGIETDMIDRFVAYVGQTIKALEQETSRSINPATDVALVYFLLKNEPYIKEAKAELSRLLGASGEILDGAGAALQGKERDYIFYLWDTTKYNLAFFRQGDDESKRKGELNVLMSRPKKRAFHYLHKEFESLKHHTSTITDYLWQKYQEGQKSGPVDAPVKQGSALLVQTLFLRKVTRC